MSIFKRNCSFFLPFISIQNPVELIGKQEMFFLSQEFATESITPNMVLLFSANTEEIFVVEQLQEFNKFHKTDFYHLATYLM